MTDAFYANSSSRAVRFFFNETNKNAEISSNHAAPVMV